MSERPIVLYVDDSLDEIILMRRAVKKAELTVDLEVARSGDQALELIAGWVAASRPLPRLIILDLNMPGSDGRTVLRKLQSDERLRDIPVVMWSNAALPVEVRGSVRDGARAFHLKPVGAQAFRHDLRLLFDYWLHAAVA